MKVLGKHKPLAGWCMEHLAGALRRVDTREAREEAKDLLLGAFVVECSKDIIKLSSMERLLGSVMEAHQETGDMGGLERCQEAINVGLENLHRRNIHVLEAASYAKLLQRISQVLLAHSPRANLQCALGLLDEATEHARRAVDRPASKGQAAEIHVLLEHQVGNRVCREVKAWHDDDLGPEIFTPKSGQQEILGIDAKQLLKDLVEQALALRAGTCSSSRLFDLRGCMPAAVVEQVLSTLEWERLDDEYCEPVD